MIYGNPLLLGGGSGLDLTVVGSTTQPASPKENTVWINTDTPVGEVYLQASAPASPALGDVWINTGTGYNSSGSPNQGDNVLTVMESPFLQLTIGTVKQWDGLGWSSTDVEIYKDGAWHSEVLYIFSYGTWSEYGSFDYKSASGLSISVSEDKLVINGSSLDSTWRAQITTPVDVTKYNTMTMLCQQNQTYHGTNHTTQYAMRIGLNDTTPPKKYGSNSYPGAYFNVSMCAPYNSSYTDTDAYSVSLDISSLTGLYYITHAGYGNSTSSRKWWLKQIALMV